MKNDYRYTNKNGKLVTGNASRLHQFSREDGFDKFLERRIAAGIQAFLSNPESSDIIEDIAASNFARKNIKIKNCG